MDPLTPTPEKKPAFKRLHQLLRDKKGVRYFVIAIAVLLIVGIGVISWVVTRPGYQGITTYPPHKKATPAPVVYYSPLTGAAVIDDATTKRPVTAIMIENSPDARPQSGLKEAGVVFEAIAEGGITRFVALYQESQPTLIGPVRSVRPYYLKWANAFDPAVAHIGGSALALQMVRGGGYGVDLDQFFNSGAYWRANDRPAPHNVYTDFSHLNALEATKGKTTSTFTAWPRIDDKKATAPTATSIDMPVSTGSYTVHYQYDAIKNAYVRSEGGAPHVDREEGQLEPKVVISIQIQMSTVLEDGYREDYITTGSGKAQIFQNGTVIEGTWSKADDKAQIHFLDSTGKDIPLNRGQTWVSAVATGQTSWQ